MSRNNNHYNIFDNAVSDAVVTSPDYNNPFEFEGTDDSISEDQKMPPSVSRFATPETAKRTASSRRAASNFGLQNLREDESVNSFDQIPDVDYSLHAAGTASGTNKLTFEDEDIEDTVIERQGTLVKRNRWGTQRHKSGRPKKPARATTLKWKSGESFGGVRRKSTLRKNSGPTVGAVNGDRKASVVSEEPHPEDSDDSEDASKNRAYERRSIFFNMDLPQEFKDEDGLPIKEYPRNKIRTTKYTPLTFIPKNLYIQFRNVANIYFLVLIILGFFSIFGVSNPGLSAVPLIVIVVITAIKDAIEDSRRTGSDMELNNTITHILTGVPNKNVSSESISAWRRFKKLCSRIMFNVIGSTKKFVQKQNQKKQTEFTENDMNVDRKSFESFETRYTKEIPMTDLRSVRTSETTLTSSNNFAMNHDNNVNNPFKGPSFIDSSLPVSKNSSFAKKYWKEVQVGDIVRIHNNDEIPADVVILATSDSDGGCYVETKNLDGETNLKVRQALKCSSGLRHSSDCERCKFWIESEGPHANLYSYQGVCKWNESGSSQTMSEPITINNMLLRGCFLRNTKWAIGVVVFTGDDTKIMLNSGITPSKVSKISRELNYSVIMNFILLFILCFAAGLVNGIYYARDGTSRDDYEFGTIAGSPALNGIVTFFVALILYQSLVPISLYISIEIIKTAQAFFIYSDVQMYDPRLDFPCVPKSWSISDDLGQIEYVFSDKTGTLTQNIMEFKKCTINGVSYGLAYTEALQGLRKRQGVNVEKEKESEDMKISSDRSQMIHELQSFGENQQFREEDVTFVSSDFVRDLKGHRGKLQQRANEHFMLCLAVCHSVLIEDDKKNPGKLLYKAQSPDESALVGTARDVGFAVTGRTKKGILVEVQGVEKEFQILNMLEFNSTRKRMSVIIKIPGENGNQRALLICKGADSVIYGRLKSASNQSMLEKTALHLEEYATEGLRTLCIAQRELSWEEYEAWNAKHEEASKALENREEKMEMAADEIERGLTLLGGTAIEDRLQEGVSSSIAILAKAGIKLWVLTGDKVETAINIGFSCNLLNGDMDLMVVKSEGEDAEKLAGCTGPDAIVSALIYKYLGDLDEKLGLDDDLTPGEKYSDANLNGLITSAQRDHAPPVGNFGLVIDGDALKIALKPQNKERFLLLCKRCKAVLCCRVSPAQKAAVVNLVKENLQVMTLAIGDGSNDVAMIQAADVGVGIAGEEGRQAVMSSDYGIGQFRFLTRLLLVHGRWSYKRLAEMIPSFFYKNAIFTLALFWYGIFSDFDGSYLFEYTYLMFFNLAFTSLPVILLGIFDQDVDAVVSLLVPQLYVSGVLGKDWSTTKFWFYMGDALYQSLIAFFFPYLCYYTGVFVNSDGLTLNHRYWMGCFVATISVLSCNTYVLMRQYRWDWLTLLIFALSNLVLFGWTGVWTISTYAGEFYKAAPQVYGSLTFWCCVFVGYVVCLLPRFALDSLGKIRNPTDTDIIRECVNRGDFAHYPVGYDPTDPNKVKISRYGSMDLEQRSQNTDDVATEEVPIDNKRISQISNRGGSLDITRAQMIETNELRPTMSGTGRASLDIPGVNVAASLVRETS